MLRTLRLCSVRKLRRILTVGLVGIGGGVSISSMTAGPAAAGTVRVTGGQTLSAIASRYSTTVAALAAVNGITKPNLVFAGAVLQVPTSTSGTGTTPSSTITVGRGDTLSSVAARYHTTVRALAATNGISNANLVYVGAHLRLPGQSMAPASYTAPASGRSGALPPMLLAHPARLALRPDFVQSAATYGVPVSLLEALCWWESGWQLGVVSSTGAIGLCQIEPSTAKFVSTVLFPGRGLDLNTAAGNIAIGAAYLHSLLVRAGGSQSIAVAGYYQGLTSVEQRGILPATRNYVAGILAYSSVFASAG